MLPSVSSSFSTQRRWSLGDTFKDGYLKYTIIMAFTAGTLAGMLINFRGLDLADLQKERSVSTEGVKDGETCGNWLPRDTNSSEDPWHALKLIVRPAACTVKGFVIEELDPENNFRRGFTLGYSQEVRERSQTVPYFLATQDLSLHERTRRILLDIGHNNDFDSSVGWFTRMYPLDFTEIHVFRADMSHFHVPPHHPSEEEDLQPINRMSERRPKGKPVPIPNFVLDRITVYNVNLYFDEDLSRKPETWSMNRTLKETLHLAPDDAVIVNMDLQGNEWTILREWLTDPEMPVILDEIFVQLMHNHPSMHGYQWSKFFHGREQVTEMLTDLRAKGFFVHYLP